MRIDILTLFPEMLEAKPLQRALSSEHKMHGHVEIHVHDIRTWANNKHRKVDDRPFGGGPGMVMMCQPLHDAVQEVERQSEMVHPFEFTSRPQGEVLKQERVEQLATEKHLLLIAGHYEGIDERVIETLDPLELSTGDYVLSGGEIPALLLVDAVVRLLPGVLGHVDSADQDSFSQRDAAMANASLTAHTTRVPVYGTKRKCQKCLLKRRPQCRRSSGEKSKWFRAQNRVDQICSTTRKLTPEFFSSHARL